MYCWLQHFTALYPSPVHSSSIPFNIMLPANSIKHYPSVLEILAFHVQETLQCFPDEVLGSPPKQHPASEWQLQPDSIPEPATKKQCCDDLRDRRLDLMANHDQQLTDKSADDDTGAESHEDCILLHAEDCAIAAPISV